MCLLLTLLTAGCASDEEGRSSGSIYGIVTTTGEPLKGIGVSLYKIENNIPGGNIYGDSQLSLLLKTVTYDDGSYEFTDLRAGRYRLTVETENYEKFETNVVVEAGRQARADMKLTKKNIYLTASTTKAEVTANNVRLTGTYKYYSGYSPNEYGFYYSQDAQPAQNGQQVTGTYADYSFTADINGLAPGTYYYQAYAKNRLGTALGDILSFTVSGSPVIKTNTASDITPTSIMLNGEVVYAGQPPITEKGFVYSTNYPTPTLQDGTAVKVSGNTAGQFSYRLTGCSATDIYYIRAYARNADETIYGEVVEADCREYVELPAAGIMVQKYDLGAADYEEAVATCQRSSIGGYTDWRLPTLTELQIIYDNRNKIDNLKSKYYWSSSPSNYYEEYYVLHLYNGTTDSYKPYHITNIRAVRTIEK